MCQEIEYNTDLCVWKLSITQVYVYVLEQSLWLNKHITIQQKPICWKNWENNRIRTISNILDEENNVLSYKRLNRTYKLTSTYLELEQIKSSIPNI